MTYSKAVVVALFKGWGDIVCDDAVCGNGFVIFAYGVKLIAKYAVLYALRFIVAATAPLSALLVMKMEKRTAAFNARAERAANRDL